MGRADLCCVHVSCSAPRALPIALLLSRRADVGDQVDFVCLIVVLLDLGCEICCCRGNTHGVLLSLSTCNYNRAAGQPASGGQVSWKEARRRQLQVAPGAARQTSL